MSQPIKVHFLQQATCCNKIAMEALTIPRKDGTIELVNGNWNKCQLSEVSQLVKQWDVKIGLFLYANRNPCLLKHIRNICFPYLQQLGLAGNYIETLEDISQLNAPQLSMIRMDYNRIYSIASIKNGRFPKLKTIIMNRNMINDFSPLEKLNSKQLGELNLELFYENDQAVNINWVFKLQASYLGELKLQSLKRIPQNNKCRALRRRYKHINFVNAGRTNVVIRRPPMPLQNLVNPP